jgi:methanethiol S-methyltransferase
MQRKLFFVYGVLSHTMFLVVYAWMAAFVGNFGFGLIRTIDSAPSGSFPSALAINAVLIALFGVQHSVMARPTFKQRWTRYVPQPIERATYVLISNLLMILLMWQWRPMGIVIWDVQAPAARIALHALFAIGWLMVPAVSLLINHFDLFGTRQVWLALRGREYTSDPFRTPMIYRYIRHPLYLGWMIAFWATPTMSLAHLVFAMLMTAYMLIAIPFEERNLIEHFGDAYRAYRERTGKLLPKLRGELLPAFDARIFGDISWWSWLSIIALLTIRLATGSHVAIVAAIAICSSLAILDLIMRRGDVRAISMQIRITYVFLLIVGMLPGSQWMHVVQLIGTSVRVLTGYCLLERELRLFSWNRSEPLTMSLMWRTLTARPGRGGCFCLDTATNAADNPCAMPTRSRSNAATAGCDPVFS